MWRSRTTLEVGFDASPGSLDPVWSNTGFTWTDVSDYLAEYSGSRGGSEFAGVTPGALTVVLDNSDGRFDPSNGSSPYAGTMKSGLPIRVREQINLLPLVLSTGDDVSTLTAIGTPTLTVSSAQARSVTSSIRVTNASGTIGFTTPAGTSGYRVWPGEPLTAAVWMLRTTATGRTVTVSIRFFDAAGSTISTATGTGVTSSAAWQQVSVATTAPSAAAWCAVRVEFAGAAVGDVHHVDDLLLVPSSGTGSLSWFPGGPIDVFRGQIDSWLPAQRHPGESFTTLACSGMLAAVAAAPVAGSLWATFLERSRPDLWWRLGERSEQDLVADSSGNGNAGRYRRIGARMLDSLDGSTAAGLTATGGSTVTSSTTTAYTGDSSIKVTGGSGTVGFTGTTVTVYPGKPFTLSAWFKRTSATARQVTLSVSWFSAAVQPLGKSAAAATDSSTSWQQATVSGTTPAGAAFAWVQIEIASAVAGDVHYVDDLWLGHDGTAITPTDGLIVQDSDGAVNFDAVWSQHVEGPSFTWTSGTFTVALWVKGYPAASACTLFDSSRLTIAMTAAGAITATYLGVAATATGLDVRDGDPHLVVVTCNASGSVSVSIDLATGASNSGILSAERVQLRLYVARDQAGTAAQYATITIDEVAIWQGIELDPTWLYLCGRAGSIRPGDQVGQLQPADVAAFLLELFGRPRPTGTTASPAGDGPFVIDVVPMAGVLEMLNIAAVSGQLTVFEAADGEPTVAPVSYVPSTTLAYLSTVTIGFGAGEYPYIGDPTIDFGEASLINHVTVARPDLASLVYRNQTSIAARGVRTVAVTVWSTVERCARDLAAWTLAQYGTEGRRLTWIRPDVLRVDTAQAVLWTELGDVITVKDLTVDGRTITTTARVVGKTVAKQRNSAGLGVLAVELSLALVRIQPIVLDSATYGGWGTGVLGP